MRNVSDKSFRENQKHFMPSNFLLQTRTVSKKMWKNMVQPCWDTDDNIIPGMRLARWITDATDTHSEYVNTHCFSMAATVTRTRLNITLMRTQPALLYEKKRELSALLGRRDLSSDTQESYECRAEV
jgi:hypothetical protein